MKYPTVILIDQQRKDRVKQLIDSAPLEPVLEVIIREHKSSRSLAQNNCLHGWCKQIATETAEATGKFYPPDQWKKHLKSLFLGYESFEINGQVVTELKSTAKLKVDEFKVFLDNIDHYAGSELQIILERGEDYSLAIYGRKKE